MLVEMILGSHNGAFRPIPPPAFSLFENRQAKRCYFGGRIILDLGFVPASPSPPWSSETFVLMGRSSSGTATVDFEEWFACAPEELRPLWTLRGMIRLLSFICVPPAFLRSRSADVFFPLLPR